MFYYRYTSVVYLKKIVCITFGKYGVLTVYLPFVKKVFLVIFPNFSVLLC